MRGHKVGGADDQAGKQVNRKTIFEADPRPATPSARMFTVRRATPEDVAGVMDFIPRVVAALNAGGNFQWNHEYPLASDFEKDAERNELWVVTDDSSNGRIVGVGALTTEQYPEYALVGMDPKEESIVPHRVAVDVDYRGKGIAQRIIAQAEVLAKERGYRAVRVDTNVINAPMRHVFEKLGYTHMGDVPFSFKPPEMRFCCFEKKV